ncbi:MAG: TlpA disulfide reductase family protein [Saprospiraceae bacterium]|nr:TlpA family protein disulfide reductase [Saprospiraceae bacterium]
MKKLFLLVFLIPASLMAFQSPEYSSKAAPGRQTNNITLNCRVYGVASNLDSMYLYENMGLANRVVARAGRSGPDSSYVISIPASSARFYLLGSNEQSTKEIILGEEKSVTIWGNSNYMHKARTVNSAVNTAFEKVQERIEGFINEGREARGLYRLSKGSAKATAKTNLEQFTKRKTMFLDSLKNANPLLHRYAALKLTPDFSGEGSEADFYGMNYFGNADLRNKAYEDVPEVYTAFAQYTAELLNLGMTHEKTVEMTEAQLAKLPAGSRTYRMALGGVVSTLKSLKSAEYPGLAKKYIDTYKNQNYGEIPGLEMEVRRAGTYLTGYEAPDLMGYTPDSSTYSLKQMRGKIVMVDFWASWCGPCRKENPNVIANYNKYKDKGFDILGVSLDRNADAWKKAIDADGLPWHHISDLKGWQSSHAALYSVTSIPQTVLIDREGKIIARNLRGEQLGAKLAEIFGEN